MAASLLDLISMKDNGPDINLKIFVATWNMGNAQAEGHNFIFTEKDALNTYDIFAIGLQESTYSVEINPTFDSISHLKSVFEKMFAKVSFMLVEHCHRAQLQMYVFAKTSIQSRISNIEKSIENTGFLHVFPNKGGLLISFHVDSTKIAFISCHLTAHEGIKHCEERNASIIEILGGVRAGDKRFDVTEQFHHCFFMGDMNYRLTYDHSTPKNKRKSLIANTANTSRDSMSSQSGRSGADVDVEVYDEVDSEPESDGDYETTTEKTDRTSKTSNKTAVSSGKKGQSAKELKKKLLAQYRAKTMKLIVNEQYTDLLKHDELNRELTAGRVLNGFTALQPQFPPTFKRTRGISIKNHIKSGIINTAIDNDTSIASTNLPLPPRKSFDNTSRNTILNSEKSSFTYADPKKSTFGEEKLSLKDDLDIMLAPPVVNDDYENGGMNSVMTVGKKEVKREFSTQEIQGMVNNLGSYSYDAESSTTTGFGHTGSNSSDAQQELDNELIHTFYNTKRMPSYCDRILYKSLNFCSDNLAPLFFDSCEAAISSDHKPVRAGFNVQTTKGAHAIQIMEEIIIPKPKVKRGLSRSMSSFNFVRSMSSRSSLGSNNNHSYGSNIDEVELSALEMSISNLKASNLEEMDLELFGGGSDPYIVITTEPASLLLQNIGTIRKSEPKTPATTTTTNNQPSNNRTASHIAQQSTFHQKYRLNPEHPGLRTEVIKHNCDPIWHEKIEFFLASHDLIGLSRNASIVFTVWDSDVYTDDDLIGVLTISFKDILKSHLKGTAHHFTEYIRSNSEIMGKLSGTVTIEGGISAIHEHFTTAVERNKYISLATAEEFVLNNAVKQNKCAACVVN